MMKRCSEDENIFYRDLGERLRILRKYKNFSQEKLARELNLTFQQIQKYESGVNRIPLTKLLHICNLLETTLDFFLPAGADRRHSIENKDLELLTMIDKTVGKENLFYFLSNIKENSNNPFGYCIPTIQTLE